MIDSSRLYRAALRAWAVVGLLVAVSVAGLFHQRIAHAIGYQPRSYVTQLGVQSCTYNAIFSSVAPQVGGLVSGACNTVKDSVSCPNAVAGDAVVIAVQNSSNSLELSHNAYVSATGTIQDQVCNFTAGSIGVVSQIWTYTPVHNSFP
jgi:hypothetical protein